MLVEEPSVVLPSTYETKGPSLMNLQDAQFSIHNTLETADGDFLTPFSGCFALSGAVG